VDRERAEAKFLELTNVPEYAAEQKQLENQREKNSERMKAMIAEGKMGLRKKTGKNRAFRSEAVLPGCLQEAPGWR
jgi:hypothetical protein